MSIAENYQDIEHEMKRAILHFYCADKLDDIPDYAGLVDAGGALKLPQIIAVSKQQSGARIDEALAAGLRHFGENKVQEAQKHWAERKAKHDDLVLHLIGPLQSNKVKDAVALFDVIHSVDREKIARVLKAEMDAQGRQLPCYIQVNIGEEEQKSGVLPHELDDFLAFCRNDLSLDIKGLMCIPPVDEPAGIYFSLLKKMADAHDDLALSMGMSGDYTEAALCGAHYVRIGTALLVER
ncbi:MAG: YggS family pyridoxal phosphate-dependent enzyme [Pseudomonadota bacterium]|nr:YggS family pyridoxal phosphate-dependent enzyme [Pseudomonadota bacterium]